MGRLSTRVSRAPAGLRPPREHGFWVLLAVALGAPLLDRPTPGALLAVLAAAGAFTLGAALVGKRIRKNPWLQTLASVSFGVAAGLIELAGGARLSRALWLGLGLAAAFVAGAACVRAVLERQRRHPRQARLWAAGSWVVPLAMAAVLTHTWGWLAAAALGVTTAYALVLVVLSPSAHSLRLIGLTLSAAHTASALLLIAG